MPVANAGGADRNLLFGILAVNLNFITRDQLIVAMNTWVLDKNRLLDAILLEQQALTPERHALLQALVVEHIRQHDGDPQRSLAAVSSVASVKKALAEIEDRDVEKSLAYVAMPPDKDPGTVETQTFAVGAPTSTGQRFRILRPHAKGGLGQVYVAEDQELHREVALKEIQDKHAGDQESRTRFLLEAEITGCLEHPGIVPVYGLGTYADGRPYYAMRFIQGDSLKDAIQRFHIADVPGRDPGERALELRKLLGRFVDVCEAIQYAHDRGILHRDLKPGNIMLGKYGETLVVDWGLAKLIDQAEPASTEPILRPSSASGTTETLPGRALGTPQYMSPEQAAGRLEDVTAASDVYSLGATLHTLLTGKASVEDSAVELQRQADVGKLLGKVAKGDIAKPRQVKPNVSPALEAICLKAMALKPTDRYLSPRQLASDLEQWLADEPVSAWPEPWTVKARRWVGKHRTLVTGAAAALLVGVVSLTVSTILLADANDRIRSANRDLSDANTAISDANITILGKNKVIEAEVAEKEKQRLIAVANEGKAVAAHKKSEERLDQSVATLKLFANDVRTYCEDAIVPGDSKDRLFGVVLDQLEELAEIDQGKEFNEDKIRARIFLYETVALTQIELGRTVKAEPSLGKALKLTDLWLQEKPDDPGALGRRAAVLHLFGVIHSRRFNMKIAGEYYTQSYEIRKKLLGNPKVERFTPGKTIIDLADSLDAMKRWEEAIEMRIKAFDFVTKHLAGQGGKQDEAHLVVDGLNWTYQKAAEKTDDYEKRKGYLEKANETSVALAKLRPNGRVGLERWDKNLRLFADVEHRQAYLATLAKQNAKAKEHYAVARTMNAKRTEIGRKLTRSDDLVKHRRALADGWYELARVEKQLGLAPQAKGHFETCLYLREGIVRDSQRLDADDTVGRLFPLVTLGRHIEAAGEADKLLVKFASKNLTYATARVYALCVGAVAEARKSMPLDETEKKLQAAYRDSAFRCLEDSVKQGFDRWEDLRSEPDFAAVRDDPRFQKVLQREKKRAD